MKNNHKPFCARSIVFALVAGLLGQIFLPSVSHGSIGAGTPPGGAGLVKEQLAGKAPRFITGKPVRVYVVQAGDVFSDILVKSGVSRKDALYISKKANAVHRLTRMKPGSELEFHFSPDGTCLHEIGYKVSSRKKVVLYNGRVINLAQARPMAASEQAQRPRTRVKEPGKEEQAFNRKPAASARMPRHAAQAVSRSPGTARPDKVSRLRPPSGAPAISQAGPAAQGRVEKSAMRASSSYNCGIPEPVRTSPQVPYEMLSSGLVMLPPILPMKDRDSFEIPGHNEPLSHGHRVMPTNEGTRSSKKDAALSRKNGFSKKARKTRIARAQEPPFLGAPLTYRCISSGFSHSRLNPITNEVRPHLGVDYSAPTGTPVRSIGAGRVCFIGWDGGYGKTVRIVHPNGFTTHYAHLSRYTRSLMVGRRVRKGETIGYVGMTGNATGPHLDFRMTRQGTYINPVNMEYSLRKSPSRKSAGRSRRAPRG